jgi:3-oxoacyl-ACP reductase-like protein
MSIFTKIKNVVLGRPIDSPADGVLPTQAPAAPAAPTASQATATAPAQPQPQPAPQPVAEVDVIEVLSARAAAQSQELNWRTSIVDLMKLLDIDSSLENRRALAQELGYTGDTGDTATMNMWLHRQVMRELAANGGRVPAELTD